LVVLSLTVLIAHPKAFDLIHQVILRSPLAGYSAFDKLRRVSPAAIVENKRLGEILAWIKEQQDRQPGLNTSRLQLTGDPIYSDVLSTSLRV